MIEESLFPESPNLTDTTDELVSYAEISVCDTYRYLLGRQWDIKLPLLGWLILNPSTADTLVDDATIRKCCAFARLLGCGGIMVANLFAFRATDPRELYKHADAVGPENDEAILKMAKECPTIIAAWATTVSCATATPP